MGKEALIVDDVSMKFNLSSEKVDNIKEYIIKSIKRQISYDEFWSLKHVSFSLDKGDRLGILGLNGAGKSTLLKVISGVYKPTEGHVIKHGKVVPLLELGAGFDAQYTGKENIFCMVQCSDIPRVIWKKSMMRSLSFRNLDVLLMSQSRIIHLV
mgnify:CR=1 FL=1